MKQHRCHRAALALALAFALAGCGAAPVSQPATGNAPADSLGARPRQDAAVSAAAGPTAAPSTGGGYEAPPFAAAAFDPDAAVWAGSIGVDLSAVEQGVVAVRAEGEKRMKCQIVFGEVKYNYDLPQDGTPIVCPLQSGDGLYTVRVLQNTVDNKYAEMFSQQLEVALESEFAPFLRPNQRVDYSESSACVQQAARLAAQAPDALGVVNAVYEYICGNITYDHDKARWVVENDVRGYLPDPDETLAEGKGICYDYAALAAAMLRSQGIPTKLITGYVDNGGKELYHAWNMIWIEESGWIAVEIKAPQHSWQRVDLTFAAAGAGEFVGEGAGYVDSSVY